MKYRTKIAIFEDEDINMLEQMVNEFIEDKEVINISSRYLDVTRSVKAIRGNVTQVYIRKIITIIYKEYTDMVEYGGC